VPRVQLLTLQKLPLLPQERLTYGHHFLDEITRVYEVP